MLKLTRLNQNVIVINPDHVGWVEALPDTTLFMVGGEKILVLETVDELIARVIEYRRTVRMVEPGTTAFGTYEGDPPRGLPGLARHISQSGRPRASSPPRTER